MTIASGSAVREELGMLSLARRSLTYALGGFAYKGLALISVPLVARLLTPAELGLLDYAAVVAAVVGLAVAAGSEQAVAYLDPRSTPDDRVWESTLVTIGSVAVAVLVPVGVVNEWLASLLTGDPENGPVIIAAALYGCVIALTSVALNAVRLRGSPRAYAITSFLVVAAEMAGAVMVALLVASPVTLMVVAWAGGASIVAL
ncbi:MAG TPA: oligosaccharide flippase family protein, partial [Thermomicrobiales bacterium]|nr:oligosaccharide flippase family protein [Thermomicrobiales bacterium]